MTGRLFSSVTEVLVRSCRFRANYLYGCRVRSAQQYTKDNGARLDAA
jgi:hypothetical protein